MEKYKIVKKIEENPNTSIYKVKKISDDRVFIIKTKSISPEFGIPAATLREIKAMKKFNSFSQIELLEIITEPSKISLVLEYFPFTLDSLFANKFVFCSKMFDSIMVQLFKAVAFIHKRGMIHRNLNPSHILLDTNCRLTLSGFSQARYENNFMTNNPTSLHYRAPELLLGDISYTNKIDSWSIGCILTRIKTGELPFCENDEIAQCQKIFKTFGPPDCEYPWSKIFDVQQYKGEFSLDSFVVKTFGQVLDDRTYQIIRELFHINNKQI